MTVSNLKGRVIGNALPVLLAALTVVALPLSAGARPLAQVLETKTLKVIAYEDNRPFSWTNDDGAIAGIDVDLAKAIAKEIGVEPDIELRMQAERADGDVRVNIIRGTVGGGAPGDILMHVPVDDEFAKKFKEAVLGDPYYQQNVALAIDPKRIPETATFDIFKTEKIGVKLATVADYFLMGYADGALVNNISHHTRGPVGVKEFLSGEVAALMGVRSEIEGLLHEQGAKATFIAPPMPDIIRSQWLIGIGYHDNSRDLGDAVGQAVKKLQDNGKMKEIFAKYGVTHIPPPGQ